jgi:low affinity Fe/Cu permease
VKTTGLDPRRKHRHLSFPEAIVQGTKMQKTDCSTKKDRPGSSKFSAVALWASRQCGHASTFVIACMSIVVWAATGPIFGYSDTWQLVINTGTTIVTFLMVFLIQNTQNRDMSALHLKLDELIRVNHDARNKLLDLEDLTEEELDQLKATFSRLAGDTIPPGRAADAVADLDRAEEDITAAKRRITS